MSADLHYEARPVYAIDEDVQNSPHRDHFATGDSSGGGFPWSRNSGAMSNASGGSSESSIAQNRKKDARSNVEHDRFVDFTPAVAVGETGKSITYPVDIVAVNAFTGKTHSTWESEGVIWLRDILPKDLPGARIFSYGYDAAVFNSFGKANGTRMLERCCPFSKAN
jgi:hypothetical protein